MLCKGVKHAGFERIIHDGRRSDGRLIWPDLRVEVVTQEEVRRRCREGMRHHLSDSQTTVQKYATMVAVQTLLANCTIDLVQAVFSPSPALVIGSVTIADFTGYAQVSIVAPTAPFYDAVLGGVSIALPATFTCTGSAVSNTIFGYVLPTAGPAMVQSGLLAAPIAVNTAHQAIPINVLVNLQ